MTRQEPPPPGQPARRPDPGEFGGPPEGCGAPTWQVAAGALERAATGARRRWRAARTTILQAMARHPRAWRALVAGVVILGVVAFVIGIRSPHGRGPEQVSPDTRRFYVSSRPTLVFEHFIGRVHLASGPDGQVSVTENRNGETDQIQIHYGQRGDAITVTADIPGGLMEDTWVDFDVAVPGHAGFGATVPTGTLEATGLSGEIALSDANGSIWATDLRGVITLSTQSGSINLTGVTGQVSAATQNGTITTTATRLEGRSKLRAENGTINFHGALDRAGRCVFQNGNGAVGLALPSDSAFALSASTATGSINTDFPHMTISHQGGRSEARGETGPAPRAQLAIETTGGSIGVFQGG